ncbi:HAD family hydrolase [Serratia marcescens]|uniref:HAD family hydrolase n=1 Tax=Serratia marcescens TaxID=615 RepID=UPI003FA6D7B5
MDNTIIISDLDGTLLSSNGRISEATFEWISHWLKQDRHFIIATGRHYRNVIGYFDGLPRIPDLITSNGAMINDKLTFPIEKCRLNCLRQLKVLADFHEVSFSVFTEEGWHVTEYNEMIVSHDFKAIMTPSKQFFNLNAFKGLFFGDPEKLLLLQNYLREGFSDYVSVRSDECWLEIHWKEINKFAALKNFLKESKLDKKMTIAFGDGLNDVELLKGCTLGVLMDNAMPELKSILHGHPITVSNDSEGVRIFLEQFFS